MEKEIEPFTDEEYEPRKIGGRMTLRLYGEKGKLKKVKVDKVSMILDAIARACDIDIRDAFIDGDIDINTSASSSMMDVDAEGKYIIAGRISIVSSTIKGRVDFSNSHFKRSVHFWRSHFQTTADFTACYFEQGPGFSHCRFEERIHFGVSKLESPAFFVGAKLQENTVPKGFWNYILLPMLCLSVCFLGKAKRRQLRSWLQATVTHIYGINTTAVMDSSDNPRLKRYIDDEQWIYSWRTNPKGRWWREPVFRLWELTSHCGRSIGLWIAWSMLIALVFALIYHSFGADSITFNVPQILAKGLQPGFREYLYYSTVTFTTLGFGDIVPLTNWARLAVGVEVFLGYLMLGGLISIFANKFARRS